MKNNDENNIERDCAELTINTCVQTAVFSAAVDSVDEPPPPQPQPQPFYGPFSGTTQVSR